MWVLRVYNRDDDLLVAEHELAGVDWDDLKKILGFAPSAYVSTPLDGDALGRLNANGIAPFSESVRENWEDREFFLDFDADPQYEQPSRHAQRALIRRSA